MKASKNHDLLAATSRVPELRIAHVSATDVMGGAARGAYSLHRALLGLGLDSRLFVGRKTTADPTVFGPSTARDVALAELRPALDSRLACAFANTPSTPFTSNLVGSRLPAAIERSRPDIVHLHFFDRGLLHLGQIGRFQAPVVWTMRGMGAFTGGCELDDGCGRFVAMCGRCPLIGSTRERDITRLTMRRKHRAWAGRPIFLVAISSWIGDQASRSSLFRDATFPVIHPGIDCEAFRPTDRDTARRALRLPLDRRIVAFSSLSRYDVPHKGWTEFVRALETLLAQEKGLDSSLLVLLVGLEETPDDLARLPIESVALGTVRDTALLALAYSAADVLALPSRLETFGKVAAEALACGTPVVAFDRLGVADVIEHRRNGYLASQGSVEDFAAGLAWVLDARRASAELGSRARESALERLSPEVEARAYRDLYRAILAGEVAPSTRPR